MPSVDPITIEVIGSALESIVEEMGEVLVRSSYSTNIKERRDCSTALFDGEGNVLCQAEHIPMHLGSFIGILGHINECFETRDIKPGDVFIGNDPCWLLPNHVDLLCDFFNVRSIALSNYYGYVFC